MTRVLVRSLALLCALLVPSAALAAGFDHKPFDHLLQEYVKKGRINYKGWKADAKASKQLDDYLVTIAAATPKTMKSKDERLAFWINAYNACVIDMVLERYPLKSVMDHKGFFDKLTCKVAGKGRTLNSIENDIIRPRFKEARIHFALVCAAVSCPPIQRRAYFAKGLRRTLDQVTKTFLTGPGVKIEGGNIKLSKLFDWYGKDFVDDAGSVKKYAAKYVKGADAEGLTVAFQNYDWALNE